MTDGHSSRFDLDVLRFCDTNQILQFLSPPDTTGLLQPLDQINAALHSAYRRGKQEMLVDEHINREKFMNILDGMWSTWANQDAVTNSFRRCGVTKSELNVGLMQQDKFTAAKLICEDDSPQTPRSKRRLLDVESPKNVRKGCARYWKIKYERMQSSMETLVETPIDPEEVRELTQPRVQRYPAKKSKNFRITQVHGSLTGQDILKKREEMEREEQAKLDKIEQKKGMKDELKRTFLVCEEECKCGDEVCKAKGLKKCSLCGSVMKSQCSKVNCRIASGGKPLMILPARMNVDVSDKTPAARNKSTVYNAIYSDSSSESDEETQGHVDADDCWTEANHVADQLKAFWSNISPPTTQDQIVGKWYAAIYEEKNRKSMCIGRATQRFLTEKDGTVTHLELDCLKPQVGNGNMLESYPDGQSDVWMFELKDVFGGKLACTIPTCKRRWIFPDINKARAYFNQIQDVDRASLATEFTKNRM